MARGLPAYCVLSAADVALAATGNRRARRFTKPLLMPVLAVHVAGADNSRDTKPLVLAGLGLSGVGDVALLTKTDARLAAGMGAFLSAHCCYLAAFSKRRRGGVRRAPWLAGAYGLAWLGLNAKLWPRTGRLRLPVVVYGSALAAMAVAALDTDVPAVVAGGAAFLVSDSILALNTFGDASSPTADALVMLTYTAAQGLIAVGLTDASP